MKTVFSLLLIFFSFGAPHVGAANLTVAGGLLTGATEVNVSGTLYDVNFQDGSCITVFSGCNDVSDFTFNTLTAQNSAATALANQVFTGVYDSNPGLIFGCINTIHSCQFLTPAGLTPTQVTGSLIINHPLEAFDMQSGFANLITNDTTGNRSAYAVWTPTLQAVPAPSALLLFGTGLAGLIALSRRKADQIKRM